MLILSRPDTTKECVLSGKSDILRIITCYSLVAIHESLNEEAGYKRGGARARKMSNRKIKHGV